MADESVEVLPHEEIWPRPAHLREFNSGALHQLYENVVRTFNIGQAGSPNYFR